MTVARTGTPSDGSRILPRCCVTLKVLTITDWAAVAPRSTTRRGCTVSSSAMSHGLQARTWTWLGLEWRRRLPRRSHRKCFTALVR